MDTPFNEHAHKKAAHTHSGEGIDEENKAGTVCQTVSTFITSRAATYSGTESSHTSLPPSLRLSLDVKLSLELLRFCPGVADDAPLI